MGSAGHLDPLDVEHAGVQTVGDGRVDPVDVDRHRRVLEEVHAPVVGDAAHDQVAVLVLAGMAAHTHLQPRYEHLEVVGVLDTEFLDHRGVEAGDRHRAVKGALFAPLAGDDDLLDVAAAILVRLVLGVLGLVGLGAGSNGEERQQGAVEYA